MISNSILLAQATQVGGQADAVFWGQWIIVALGILGGLGGLAAVASYFATRREMIALEFRVTRIENEIKEDRHQNQVHASTRSQTLFSQIEKVREELDSKLEETRRELSEKIDDMPERVIATLKNTGAI